MRRSCLPPQLCDNFIIFTPTSCSIVEIEPMNDFPVFESSNLIIYSIEEEENIEPNNYYLRESQKVDKSVYAKK